MIKFLPSLVITLMFFLASCETPTDPAEAYKNQTPQQIFREGKSSMQSSSYADAIKHFEALDVQYPFDKETEDAQLYLIYAYYMKEEYVMSVAAADRFIRMHPTNPHVDYAYFMRGVSNYYQNLGVFEKFFAINLASRDLTQIQKSFADFKEVVTRFPRSDYAASAHQYLVYLRNIMANHDYDIAQYYYEHKAYVASANRASDLVAHYQGAPAVIPGLRLMVKSYKALGLTKLEQDASLVLRYNGYQL